MAKSRINLEDFGPGSTFSTSILSGLLIGLLIHNRDVLIHRYFLWLQMFNTLHRHRNLNLVVEKLLDISRESGFSTDDIVKHAKIDLSKPILEVETPSNIECIYNYT